MGQTLKRNYDRYTLAFKLQAVKSANHPNVMAKDVAESLGIHPVMLYRWQMEHRKGELKENKHMKSSKSSPKRQPNKKDPNLNKEIDLAKALKKIQRLERSLANREEELEMLKKAQRFFEKRKQ